MPQDTPSRHQDKFVVRLPDGLRDQLKAAAKATNRTMNAEVVDRLEAYEGLVEGASHLNAEVERLKGALVEMRRERDKYVEDSNNQVKVNRFLFNEWQNDKESYKEKLFKARSRSGFEDIFIQAVLSDDAIATAIAESIKRDIPKLIEEMARQKVIDGTLELPDIDEFEPEDAPHAEARRRRTAPKAEGD